MGFKETLELHLQSIREKNLDVFLSTVKSDEVILIMPDGNITNQKDQFEKFHKDWFMDEDWSIEFEIVNRMESIEMCSALLKVDYKDCDADGKPINIKYYLNLVFKEFDQKWLLIFDQNTLIR